jgi:thiamine-monophosphate kinase
LSGGDDYELVFTAPPSARDAVQEAARHAHTPVSRIGTITSCTGVRLTAPDGASHPLAARSFDHFA